MKYVYIKERMGNSRQVVKKITEQVKIQTIFQAALQCEIKLQLIRLDPLSFLDPGMTGNYDVLLYTSKTSEVLPKIKNKQLPPNKQKHSPKTHSQKHTTHKQKKSSQN